MMNTVGAAVNALQDRFEPDRRCGSCEYADYASPQDAVIPRGRRRWTMDLTLLRRHVPERVAVVLRIIPGIALISEIQVAVAAAHTALPDDRRRAHATKCV